MTAVLFGSISTIADSSELQRWAFNEAFQANGLDWVWERPQYVDMLATSGGQDRVASYANARGETVDAHAVHASKSRIFQEALASRGISPRPGVAQVIKAAKEQGWKVGLVTTTSPDNVAALLLAVGSEVERSSFDVIVDATAVDKPKPDKEAYVFALAQLGETPGDCVAIEDNLGGIYAAAAAGVPVLAFPNENTTTLDFGDAEQRVDRLDPAVVQGVIAGDR